MSDSQINDLFREIGVAESNSDVRILTGSSEVAVSVHAPYTFGKKTAQSDWCVVGRPSSCNAADKLVCYSNDEV